MEGNSISISSPYSIQSYFTAFVFCKVLHTLPLIQFACLSSGGLSPSQEMITGLRITDRAQCSLRIIGHLLIRHASFSSIAIIYYHISNGLPYRIQIHNSTLLCGKAAYACSIRIYYITGNFLSAPAYKGITGLGEAVRA